jgi:PEGA domain
MTPGRPTQAIILFALCSCSAVAFAQSNPQAEARKHFDQGLALAEKKAYAEAVTEFSRAYELSPHFAVLFNLGEAYVALGQPVYAVQALGRYLSEGAKEIPAKRRKQVQAEIVRQERLIAAVTFRSQIVGAVIRVDGSEVGRSPMSTAVQVSAGMHVLSAFAPGYRPWEQRLDLHGRDQSVVEIRFEPLSAPVTTPLPAAQVASAPMPQTAGAPATAPVVQSSAPPAPVAAVPPSAAAPPATSDASGLVSARAPAASGWRKPIAYVVGGLGVGSLVVGGVFGVRALSKRHDSDTLCPNDQCSQEGVNLNNQAKTAALVSDVTIGAGLVSVAVATYLLITSGHAEAAPAGNSAHNFRVLPEVGPGEARLVLGASW